MAEPISTIQLIDALSDLVADARALEMAISGSATLEPGESRALIHLAGKHLDAVKALRDSVDAAHEEAWKAREAEREVTREANRARLDQALAAKADRERQP